MAHVLGPLSLDSGLLWGIWWRVLFGNLAFQIHDILTGSAVQMP